MAKGSLLGWELRMACVEWMHVFGTYHISRQRLPCFASWWANNILASGRNALGIGLLCDCRICLYATLLTHIEFSYYLSTWGTGPQRIAYKGSLRSKWNGQLASRPYVHVCYFLAGIMSGGSSQFRVSTPCLLPNTIDMCDCDWRGGL